VRRLPIRITLTHPRARMATNAAVAESAKSSITRSHTPGQDLNGKIEAEVAGGEKKVKSEKERMAPQRLKPYCFSYCEYSY
jgi:hypothetical protein